MTRTIPGLLLAGGWLLLLLFGSFHIFWGAVVLIGLLGSREFIQMVIADEFSTAQQSIISLIISFPILTTIFAVDGIFLLSPGILLAFAGMLGFIMFHYASLTNPFETMMRGILGIIFIGFLASHLVMIRSFDDGIGWLIILTAITAGSDTGAYWVGCRWGKRKLCPSISPNKTVEGAVGGIAGAVIAALIVFSCLDVQTSVLMVFMLAIFLSIVGMVGDLLESMIKRGTNTKDSGTLLRGHGGILDRVDSLLFAGPFLYYILHYLYN